MTIITRSIHNVSSTASVVLPVPGFDADRAPVTVAPSTTLDLFTVLTDDEIEAIQPLLVKLVAEGVFTVIASTDTASFNPLGVAVPALTSSRAVATTAGGVLTASATTATELGYVNGVTSAIQTQLNAKVNITGTDNVTITNSTLSTDALTITNATESKGLLVNGKILTNRDNGSGVAVGGPDFNGDPVYSYSGIYHDNSYTDNGSLKTRFITGGNEGMDVELQSTADILISAVANGSYTTGILKLNSSTNVVINARTTSDTLSVCQLLIDRVNTGVQGTGNTSDVNLTVNSGNLCLLASNTTGAVAVNTLTTTQRDALTKVVGMLIWNSSSSHFEGWNGSTWSQLDN